MHPQGVIEIAWLWNWPCRPFSLLLWKLPEVNWHKEKKKEFHQSPTQNLGVQSTVPFSGEARLAVCVCVCEWHSFQRNLQRRTAQWVCVQCLKITRNNSWHQLSFSILVVKILLSLRKYFGFFSFLVLLWKKKSHFWRLCKSDWLPAYLHFTEVTLINCPLLISVSLDVTGTS